MREKTPEEVAHEARIRAKARAEAAKAGGSTAEDLEAEEEGGEGEEIRLGTAFSVMQTEKGLLQSVIHFDMEPFSGIVLRVRGDGKK